MKMKICFSQWAWMIGIWVASVAALGIVSALFRLMMTAAGFKS
ncbi:MULTISPECIES: DUF2474 domain-containing protein [unclassified Vibrio]|nr:MULTISPECIES: DUF2474 domain-containing protein [unclassified Vibrio]NAW60003.1 DUF2474 family protein [Vibrio sp. V36_P2S2PM302]NAX19745.1 DUF2474 family protein [Vibrio sp. V39_P1S14PM300]NAX24831.1 DUF2474 family protein [Vibrio sp. V38_P2S17PM301]NAX30004.1 DUF2474 family protein [Vibrio sp. V37_P2S8PM304]